MIIINNDGEERPILDFSKFLKENPLRDEEIHRQREEQEAAERLDGWKVTGMPERYLQQGFETYNGNADQVVKIGEYANASKHIYCGVLVILGGYGTGKTHLSCACLKTNTAGRYVDMPTLEIELECSRDFSAKQNKADTLQKYTKPALLVMDEIGRFQNAQAERQALYYILNARYNKRLNTILVSNLNKKEFGEYIGNATADRIAEKRVIVELTGVSYRKQ
jgi:DNA replication protein DnaC